MAMPTAVMPTLVLDAVVLVVAAAIVPVAKAGVAFNVTDAEVSLLEAAAAPTPRAATKPRPPRQFSAYEKRLKKIVCHDKIFFPSVVRHLTLHPGSKKLLSEGFFCCSGHVLLLLIY